jgi:cytochrome c biogenesis protein CcmG/thiol:disulfide interchange protein DsbE
LLSTSSSKPPSDAPAAAGDTRDPAGSGPTRRGKWILAAIAVVVVLVVGGITAAVVSSSDGGGDDDRITPKALSARVGEPAPDFSLTTLDGKELRLSDFEGTPVVSTWASWCTPCREEFPLLKHAYAQGAGAWQLIGVDTQDLIKSDGRRFVKQQRATWPNGYDGDGAVKAGYGGGQGLPQTVFIDPDGVIRQHLYGPLTQEVLDEQLAKIGAG